MANNTSNININIPAEKKAQFKAAVQLRGQSLTWVILKAIDEYIESPFSVVPSAARPKAKRIKAS